MMSKVKRIIKNNRFFYVIYNRMFSLLLSICKIFIKVDDKTILFNSFGGRKFNDSPKAIYNYIINNNKYDNYKIYWVFDDKKKYELIKGKKVKNNSLKFFYIALKAKYWITNTSMERGIKFKNKKTIYINTWHGSAIKCIEKDRKDRKFNFNINKSDIYFAQSKYDVDTFSKVFEVPKERFIIAGLPRNDELINPISGEEKDKIKERLNIPKNKKIILYAPTYREYDNYKNQNYIKPPINIKKWKKQLNGEFVLLFRMHHETEKALGMNFNEFIYNVSNYESLNDLFKIADILISDYSSLIFDFSILEKPIFSFAYDYEEYLKNRGCCLDINKELPNGIYKNEDELLKNIINCNYKEQKEKTRRFKEKYVEEYGNASKYIDRIILKK